jgi:hypothetical protein
VAVNNTPALVVAAQARSFVHALPSTVVTVVVLASYKSYISDPTAAEATEPASKAIREYYCCTAVQQAQAHKPVQD